MSQGRLHWMVRVARRAGLEISDHPEWIEAPIAEVWSRASEETGVSTVDLARMVALHFRLELAKFDNVEPRALRLIPGDVARRFSLLPVAETYHHLIVATADPTDLDAEQAAAFASGRTIDFAVATPMALEDALTEHYAVPRAVDTLLEGSDLSSLDSMEVVGDSDDVALNQEEVHSEPVVRLTNLIFKEAIEVGASDVHVEPEDDGGEVRFRVDGVLRKHMHLPMQALIRVISRIKVMGELDIADRIRPQDGRARIRMEGRAFDLRISTVPSRNSEKAVIRILDPGRAAGGLEDVNVVEPELSELRRVCRHPDGIVIVTGPTGSGKTTTLYAMLQELATDRVNIMTVEDPIEYRLHGITQIQVETKRGVTFASTLRAILRQDPDIIFVGEIRDLETAEIAVQASMTGHLVLATLHTNDAPAAVQRLLDLGLDGPSIAGSLRAALGQRLVRTTCSECAGVGCEECATTGYRGRRPVMELMVMNDELTALVAESANHPELRKAALAAGMRSLMSAGKQLIDQGLTTPAEVRRVLGEDVTSVAHAPASSQLRVASPASTPREAPSEAPSILVVDDDPVSRTLARSLLESAGNTVVEAADGMGAIQALQAGMYFDICILDLNMPNVGGREVLRWVRADPANADLPVIVLTGDNDEEAEIELMQAGADDYLRKPLDAARFMVRVSATLRRSSRQQVRMGGAA